MVLPWDGSFEPLAWSQNSAGRCGDRVSFGLVGNPLFFSWSGIILSFFWVLLVALWQYINHIWILRYTSKRKRVLVHRTFFTARRWKFTECYTQKKLCCNTTFMETKAFFGFLFTHYTKKLPTVLPHAWRNILDPPFPSKPHTTPLLHQPWHAKHNKNTHIQHNPAKDTMPQPTRAM